MKSPLDLKNHQRIHRKYRLKCLYLQKNIHLMSCDTVPLTKTIYFISDPIPKYIFRKFIPTTRDFSIRHE